MTAPIDAGVLARPIVDLLAGFGTCTLDGGNPADALRAASDRIDAVHEAGAAGLADLDRSWQGAAATVAVDKGAAAQSSAVRTSDRGRAMADIVTEASADLRAGADEIRSILDSFLSLAAAAAPTLTTPAGLTMIVQAALDDLSRALAVVARVRAQLAEHSAALLALLPPPADIAPPADIPPPATAPAATTAPPPPAPAQVQHAAAQVQHAAATGSSMGSAVGSALSGSGGALGSAIRTPPRTGLRTAYGGDASGSDGPGRVEPGASTGEYKLEGKGVEVTLPDGSTATAPNEQAATAVRAALGQQGVPYVWGGNAPGQGLDCSSLTKYAYGEAGVELPRLAQEQGIGHTQVDPSNLMPGDLAVWDGHVAMVIGNGQMVEAGDPVQVSAIRTENIGMQFYGFYRPTEAAGE